MSSNWPTTWDTFVLTILNAISSSPMISNLYGQSTGAINNGNVAATALMLKQLSLVLILVFEGFVDAFKHGLAMENQALRDRRLQPRRGGNVSA